MPSLANRVALVTGSTSGIGKGIAEHFASLGARVVVHGRDTQAGAQLVEAIRSRGGDAAFLQGDLADEAVCRSLVRGTVERFGGLDILVNNAASTVPRLDRERDDGVLGPHDGDQPARAVHPDAGSAHGDEGARRRIDRQHRFDQRLLRQDNLGPYSVSKGGLMTMTRNAAVGFARHRVRVNQLNVGWTLTEGEERVKREEEGLGPDWLADAVKTRPFGRLLSPQDIAHAAAYFASDDSAVITGSVLDLEQFPIGAPGTW